MSTTRLCALGHIASTRRLVEAGATRHQLSEAVNSGRLLRPRKGVYACDHLDALTTAAARVGGAVTCVSVLRKAHVWAGDSTDLHIQVPARGSARSTPGMHLHWGRPRFDMTHQWRAGPLQAVWQAIHCLDEENAIAALESAVHERFLTSSQLARITSIAPKRLADGISRLVRNSGSGLETIARLRLERAGHTVATQAFVPGLGRQDLLIDDVVAVEVDGEAWHGNEQFHVDRSRDLQATRLGRRTVRITATHIRNDWANTLTAIERAVDEAKLVRNRGTFRNSPPRNG